MPTLNLGRVRLNARGAYDNSASYEPLDVVSINGSSYFCRLPVQGVQPGTSGADSYWQFLVGVLGELDLANTVLITGSGEDGLVDSLDKRIIYVDTVADMQALAGYPLKDNQQIHVKNVGMFSYENGSFVPQSVNVQTGDSFPSPAVKDQLFILEPDGLYYYNGNEWVALINIDLLQSKVNEAETFADAAEGFADAAEIQADRAAQEVNDGIVTGIASGVEQVSTIVSAEADRAELQADRAELQADRAEGEVADGINLGVSQVTEFATEEADRAEAARDAAFVNADVYDDVAAGIAGTDEGEQFQVVEGDELVRYRNESGSAVEVARYPSVEFVEGVAEGVAATSNAAIDLASQPGRLSRAFYTFESTNSAYSIADEDGAVFAEWDEEGFQVSPARSGFFGFEEEPFFSIADEDHKPIIAVDDDLQPMVPWIKTFYTALYQEPYNYVTDDGYIISTLDENGRSSGGGGGIDATALPIRDHRLPDNAAWNDLGKVAIKPVTPEIYTLTANTQFPTTLDVYAYLDALMSEFPDYVTSEVLGVDALGNEIKQYRATPQPYVQIEQSGNYPPEDVPRPKIVITTGVHGIESHNVVAGVAFFEELCRRWNTLDGYGILRWAVDIIYVPVANPSGFDDRSRTNHNGVDINRNFPSGWNDSTSSRKGSSPASEMETQILMQLMSDNSDAIAFIDHHRSFRTSNGYERIIWMSADGQGNLRLALGIIDDYVADAKRRFDFLPVDNSPAGSITTHILGGVVRQAQYEYGIPAFLLESANNIGFNNSGTATDIHQNAERMQLMIVSRIYERYRITSSIQDSII